MQKINKPKKVVQSLAPLATDRLKAVTGGDGTDVAVNRITLNHNATMVKAKQLGIRVLQAKRVATTLKKL